VATNHKAKSEQTLEQKIAQLEQLAKESESDTALESSLARFEQGIVLAKDCMDTLDTYKGKITLLKKEADKLMESDY